MKWNLTLRRWIYVIIVITISVTSISLRMRADRPKIQNVTHNYERICPFIVVRNDFVFVSVPAGVATGSRDRRQIRGVMLFQINMSCVSFSKIGYRFR